MKTFRRAAFKTAETLCVLTSFGLIYLSIVAIQAVQAAA